MRSANSEAGAALLLVLWALTLLAVLAAAALQTVKSSAFVTRSVLEQAQLDSAADGALTLALQELIDPETRSIASSRVVQHVEVGNRNVDVNIAHESGKVNVNLDSEDLLREVFVIAGAQREDADGWAATLVHARKRPFRSLEEVAHIAAISDHIFECVRPWLTVYSGLQSVDQRYASSEVRRAMKLAGVAGDFVPAVRSVDDSQESLSGQVLFLSATVRSSDGRPNFTRETVVRLTGDASEPLLVLSRTTDGESDGAKCPR